MKKKKEFVFNTKRISLKAVSICCLGVDLKAIIVEKTTLTITTIYIAPWILTGNIQYIVDDLKKDTLNILLVLFLYLLIFFL